MGCGRLRGAVVRCADPPLNPLGMRVLGQWVGADGKLWVALPDNASPDLNLCAPARHYNATATQQKYPVNIMASSSTTNCDISTNTPEFCVGQKVTFALSGLPAGYIGSVAGNWQLPAKFVNWQTNYSSTCTTYVRNDDLLQNTPQTSCWFYNTNGNKVGVHLNLHFSNGQYANVAAFGNVTIYRPSVTFQYSKPVCNKHTNYDSCVNYGWLQLGNASQYGGDDVGTMNFGIQISSKTPFTGFANWTQLIRRSASYPRNATDTGGHYDLDGRQFYNANNSPVSILTGGSAPLYPWGFVDFYDSPGVSQWTLWSITIKDDFQT